jgi:glutathione S-transferase
MSPSKPAQPIRLHTTLLSGHGHRVKLFLTLLDLPFTINELNMAAGDNRKPAHLALNPLGEVPVIEDGDVVLSDSNAILVYLARKYGDPSWLPQDPLGAAAVQRWLSLAAGKIAYGPCAARLVTVFGAPHHLETAQKIAVKLFDVLDAELRDKPFAIGDTPTIADIAALMRPKVASRSSRTRIFARGSSESKRCRASCPCRPAKPAWSPRSTSPAPAAAGVHSRVNHPSPSCLRSHLRLAGAPPNRRFMPANSPRRSAPACASG